jgi:plastocyanin
MRGTKLHVGLVVMVASVALTAAACSKSNDAGGSTSAPTSASAPASTGGSGSATLTVKDFAFDPNSLSVASGQSTITITNDGAVTHNFSLDDGSVSQDIAPGATETVTVNITADAPFHCAIHPSMTGTLKVG